MGVNFSEFFIHCIRATPSGGANRYYRAKWKVANFISQNWGTDWEQLFKNHTKLHLLSKRHLSSFNQLFSGVNIYIPSDNSHIYILHEWFFIGVVAVFFSAFNFDQRKWQNNNNCVVNNWRTVTLPENSRKSNDFRTHKIMLNYWTPYTLHLFFIFSMTTVKKLFYGWIL
jgi:hypothetical protein